jgi:hypothetical protein
VILTTDTPPPRSAGGRALEAVCGTGRPVHHVHELLDPAGADRLAAVAAGADPAG